jgi:hypothetical protein
MSNSRAATPDFRPNMLEAPSVAKEMKFLKRNPLVNLMSYKDVVKNDLSIVLARISASNTVRKRVYCLLSGGNFK